MKKKFHLIANAHLDPVWQWDWNEGASAALATFYSAAELADEYDYIFCHNEALLYEYIEEFLNQVMSNHTEVGLNADGELDAKEGVHYKVVSGTQIDAIAEYVKLAKIWPKIKRI